MNADVTKIIADYLAGELSAADQKIFEDRMQSNEELRNEVEFQKTIVEAAKRSSIRTQVESASKSFHFNQFLKWTGIAVGTIAVITALSILVYQQFSKEEPKDISQFETLIDKFKKEELITNLPSEFFAWNGTDTAMLSKNGILISIPETAFFLNGKPYKEAALIQFQEALDAATIVKSGLSTMADDRLLETQGMFSFTAYSENGEKLTINPKTGIYIQVPVDEYKEGMQLFTGVEDKNGIINWVNPKPLAKIPVPVDMNDLNFYPPGYEDSLNNMKLRKDKKYRDSLYLSCEESRVGGQNVSVPNKQSGNALFTAKCAMCHQAHKDFTGPKLFQVRQKWTDGGAKEGSIYTWVNNWQKTAQSDPYAKKMTTWSQTAHSDNPELSIEQIDQIFDFIDRQDNSNNWKDKISWTFKLEKLDESHANIVGIATIKEGWKIFSSNSNPTLKDNFGLPTQFYFSNSNNFKLINSIKDDLKPKILNDEFVGNAFYFENKAIFKQEIEITSKEDFDIKFDYSFMICDDARCFYPENLTSTIRVSGYTPKVNNQSLGYIPPSNVFAFWKPKFNNTNLSTREFEKRMQAIHGTCNNKVLEVYTKNLNKAISELDERVVKMGYSNFSLFAAENVGAVNLNNPHIKALADFYEKGIKELREEVARNRDKEQKRKNKWDSKVQGERVNESIRSSNRENQAFNEEYTLNHKNVRKQLGRTLGMTIYTNAQISNIDKFVAETTRARKTGEFFDKETGKTARIQYNAFSVDVAKPEQYKQIYVYLFPSELNSYQRVAGKNGNFDYPLNDAIIYDMAIVGISEKGYSYFQKSKFKEGKLGTVSLEHVSEEKLNASIEQLNRNRISKPMKISDELDWLKTEQKNYVEQRNRQNHYKFQERIKRIVFPCYVVESDTIYSVVNEIPFGFK